MAVHAGPRRVLSGERVLFVAALASMLLLASVLMLRGEGGASPRAFRDGFTVAEGVVRRAESSDGSRPDAPPVVRGGGGGENTSTASNNLQVALGQDVEGGRTTTIKTQDGDEITIKHGGKKQVTTISRDEGGKITIENLAEDEAGGEAGAGDARGRNAAAAAEEPAEERPGDAEGGGLAASEGRQEADGGGARTARDGDAVIVSGGRKVTVIQVGRNLTKVELSSVQEDGEKEDDEEEEDEQQEPVFSEDGSVTAR